MSWRLYRSVEQNNIGFFQGGAPGSVLYKFDFVVFAFFKNFHEQAIEAKPEEIGWLVTNRTSPSRLAGRIALVSLCFSVLSLVNIKFEASKRSSHK